MKEQQLKKLLGLLYINVLNTNARLSPTSLAPTIRVSIKVPKPGH